MAKLNKYEVIPVEEEVNPLLGQLNDKNSSYRWKKLALHYRYLLVRLFGVPIPFLSNRIPILGGKTAADLICCILMITMSYYIPTLNITGLTFAKVADYSFAMLVLCGLRSINILNLALGISFERAIFYHKLMMPIVFIILVSHSFYRTTPNSTGVLLGTLVGLMGGVYLLKPINFQLFYYSHVALFCIIIMVAAIHGATLFAASSIFWAIDLMIRYVFTQKNVIAKFEIVSLDIISVKVETSMKYEAGQYCFLAIPTISSFEYHPFSIVSLSSNTLTNNDQNELCFYIRVVGDWTTKLYNEIKTLNNQSEGTIVELQTMIEGPYGSTSVDFLSSEYQVIVLFSGGIGVAPMLSLWNDLILQSAKGRKFRKLIFIWTVRELNTYRAINSQRLLPSGITNDMNSTELCYSDIYLTSESNKSTDNDVNSNGTVDLTDKIRFGRPNINEIMEQIENLCTNENISRVAVGICAPPSLVDSVDDYARNSKMTFQGKDQKMKVRFDCHKEVFDL